MKRFTFILLSLSALLAFSFTSCNDAQQVQPNTQTLTYTVRVNDWKLGTDEVGDYLFCEFREPALTRQVYENGMMAAYIRFSDGSLSPLPFSDFWLTPWREEQVSCEFKPGLITFIFKSDDQSSDPYFDYDFTVKLMW